MEILITDLQETVRVLGDEWLPSMNPGQVMLKCDLNAVRQAFFLRHFFVILMMAVAGIVQDMEIP